MKVDKVRDSVNCRVDEVRYFVKIVDVLRVDHVRVDQVGCSPLCFNVALILADDLLKQTASINVLKCELVISNVQNVQNISFIPKC